MSRLARLGHTGALGEAGPGPEAGAGHPGLLEGGPTSDDNQLRCPRTVSRWGQYRAHVLDLGRCHFNIKTMTYDMFKEYIKSFRHRVSDLGFGLDNSRVKEG